MRLSLRRLSPSFPPNDRDTLLETGRQNVKANRLLERTAALAME